MKIKLFVNGGIARLADSESTWLRALYVFSHPALIACAILYVLSFVTPIQFLNDISLVARFLNWVDMVTKLPTAFAEKSQFPFETRLFFELWVFLMPLMTLVLAPRIARAELRHWHERWHLKNLYWQFFMIVGLTILLVGLIVGVLIPGDPSLCKGCTTDSELGLFFIYGVATPTGIALLVAGIPSLIVFFIKSIFDDYHSRRNK